MHLATPPGKTIERLPACPLVASHVVGSDTGTRTEFETCSGTLAFAAFSLSPTWYGSPCELQEPGSGFPRQIAFVNAMAAGVLLGHVDLTCDSCSSYIPFPKVSEVDARSRMQIWSPICRTLAFECPNILTTRPSPEDSLEPWGVFHGCSTLPNEKADESRLANLDLLQTVIEPLCTWLADS